MIEQQLLMSDQASAARLRAIADEAAIQIQRLIRAGRLMEAEHLAGDAQVLLAGAAALEQLAEARAILRDVKASYEFGDDDAASILTERINHMIGECDDCAAKRTTGATDAR